MNNDTPTAKRIFDMLMQSQFWTAGQIKAFQESQLQQLLTHAHEQVPFYKQRLDAALLKNGDINWSRWHDIPILTRNDLLQHREAMQADELPESHGLRSDNWSSGTTGVAVTVTYNGLAEIAAGAATHRANHWHGIDYSKSVCNCSLGGITFALWPEGLNSGTWGPKWSERSTGPFWDINRTVTPEQLCRFLMQKKISYLTCRPQTAHAAALEALRLNIKVSLDAILCHGTGITDETRQDCNAAFGAKMISMYSSTECHKIAHPCPTTGKYHVNDELNLVEIVDEHGQACAIGTAGRVIITPFYATAQPLIRYDQGDIAIAGEKCSCGRTLSVLEKIMGRSTDLFRLPDGRRLSLLVPPILKIQLGAGGWQLAQVTPLGFEVRYVATSKAATDAKSKIIENMREQMGSNITVRFVKLDKPLLGADGKFSETVCELP